MYDLVNDCLLGVDFKGRRIKKEYFLSYCLPKVKKKRKRKNTMQAHKKLSDVRMYMAKKYGLNYSNVTIGLPNFITNENIKSFFHRKKIRTRKHEVFLKDNRTKRTTHCLTKLLFLTWNSHKRTQLLSSQFNTCIKIMTSQIPHTFFLQQKRRTCKTISRLWSRSINGYSRTFETSKRGEKEIFPPNW